MADLTYYDCPSGTHCCARTEPRLGFAKCLPNTQGSRTLGYRRNALGVASDSTPKCQSHRIAPQTVSPEAWDRGAISGGILPPFAGFQPARHELQLKGRNRAKARATFWKLGDQPDRSTAGKNRKIRFRPPGAFRMIPENLSTIE